MDGLNFKVSGDVLAESFRRDRYGSFIPIPSALPMELISGKFKKQLNAVTGYRRRLAEIYDRADRQAADNPEGNSPVVGVGFKFFGPRPYSPAKGKVGSVAKGRSPKGAMSLPKRAESIKANQLDIMDLHKSLEADVKTDRDRLLYDVESDQCMTGGGFDHNSEGDVHKAALHFIEDSEAEIDYEDSPLSEAFVWGCMKVHSHLVECGLVPGSLKPVSALYVRAQQDNDGLFGHPALASGYSPLTNDLAIRLLVEYGVDVRRLVGTDVTDAVTGVHRKCALIDAAGYILDNKIFGRTDLISIVMLLVRIQKHGWKKEAGGIVAKDGKTRAVYPNSFIQAVIEGMIAQPFNEALKLHKVDIMPSLQDKPTRVEMIKSLILHALDEGYDYLAADWSKWDASVKGHMLATMIQLVIKPFFHADYHYWVDAATVILTYKVLILDKQFSALNPDALAAARTKGSWVEVKDYYLVGITNGLISGAKWTHVGGSLYGHACIHYAIPKLLGYEPIPGPQAGDDTLVGVPLDRIDISSVEKTYSPLIEMAERFGLHSNPSKQIWHNIRGEVVKVFLQDSYHAATDCWGVGSIFRPLSAVWFSERNKNLSVAEQLLAEISRMNQGADNPFADKVVAWWLNHERYLAWLFKTYQTNGFRKLIEVIGDDLDTIAKRVEVGSFSFSVSRSDLETGNLPILDVMARVSDQLSLPSGNISSMLGDLGQETKAPGDDLDASDLADSD